METTTIKAKKDLYNNGKCFTKGQEYEVNGKIKTKAGLMKAMTKNNLGEAHIIGSFWRHFEIVG